MRIRIHNRVCVNTERDTSFLSPASEASDTDNQAPVQARTHAGMGTGTRTCEHGSNTERDASSLSPTWGGGLPTARTQLQCGQSTHEYTDGELRATSGGWSRSREVQSRAGHSDLLLTPTERLVTLMSISKDT